MGITNFGKFVGEHQPDAVNPDFKKSKAKQKNRQGRADSAFARAARADQAVVMDALTHLFTLLASVGWKNKDPNLRVTGEDVFKAFFGCIIDYFNETREKKEEDTEETKKANPVQYQLVMIFDKSTWVNPGKRAVQDARNKAKAVPGYGPHVAYTLDGVRPEPRAILQSIDVTRMVTAGGAARTTLRRFLLEHLTHSPPLLPWPSNTEIFVDSEEGVQLFRCNPQGALYTVDDTTASLIKFRNQLGEADLASVRWTLLLKRPVRLITVDTDWPMLAAYHFWGHLKVTPEIVWDNNKDIQTFKVHDFVTTLRDVHYWVRGGLVALAIFSGCDYFSKGLATDNIGHPDIYKGIHTYMRARRHPDKFRKFGYETDQTDRSFFAEILWVKSRKVDLGSLEGMRDLLWTIYARKLGSHFTPTAESLTAARTKLKLVLTPAALSELFVPYKLAYDYFTTFTCWDPDRDLPVVAGVHRDAAMRLAAMQLPK